MTSAWKTKVVIKFDNMKLTWNSLNIFYLNIFLHPIVTEIPMLMPSFWHTWYFFLDDKCSIGMSVFQQWKYYRLYRLYSIFIGVRKKVILLDAVVQISFLHFSCIHFWSDIILSSKRSLLSYKFLFSNNTKAEW